MAEPRFCSDCSSSHIGLVPCGAKSFRERLLSAQIHGSVTPSRDKRDYWNDDGLEEITGQTKAERREQTLEATSGRGYTTDRDLELAAQAND